MSKRQSRASGVSASKNPSTDDQVPLERSQSEYPTLTEAVANLSISSESQTSRPSNRRQGIYSVVPETAVLTPIRLSDPAEKLGRPVEIYTHHFPVSIEANNVNQYDVDISTIRRDGREPFNDFRKESRSSLRCDEGKTMYTKEFLTDFKGARRVTIKMANEEKVFQFKVLNLVRQEKLANIPDFLNGKSPIYPRDAIRITETLLKQTNRNWFLSIKCKHFPRNQQWVDLNDGWGTASGFHQAMCLTRSGPTMNISLPLVCFYGPLNFVDYSLQNTFGKTSLGNSTNEISIE